MKMMMCAALLATLPVVAQAEAFQLKSKEIQAGKTMAAKQEFNGFGCQGGNLSPQLAWEHVPEGTKSFAIMVYDPDAPTGSGWWHWQMVNIPVNVNEIAAGAGDIGKALAPVGSLQIENDYGFQGFGGACPPAGDKLHHYRFTVYALSVDTLPVKANASGALVGYMVKSHALASSTIDALYQR